MKYLNRLKLPAAIFSSFMLLPNIALADWLPNSFHSTIKSVDDSTCVESVSSSRYVQTVLCEEDFQWRFGGHGKNTFNAAWGGNPFLCLDDYKREDNVGV